MVSKLILKKPKIQKITTKKSDAPFRVINIGNDKPVGLLKNLYKFLKIH